MRCAALAVSCRVRRGVSPPRVRAREQSHPGEAQLALTVTHLCHALRDVLRVAHSRGDRLPAREPDAWTAAADAVLDREVDR